MPFPHMMPPGFINDIMFTVSAVIFCFLIYIRTKESYELTSHKGIMYFRDAFLFLGLSYILRFLFSIVFLSRIAFDAALARTVLIPLFILLLGYFSTVGIFYLIYSSIWKRFNDRNLLVAGHSVALALSLISFLLRSPVVLLSLQCALLAAVMLLSFLLHKAWGRISQMKVLYLLVAGLWMVNLLVIDSRRPFAPGVEILFQAGSLVVFAVIYYRISKWVR